MNISKSIDIHLTKKQLDQCNIILDTLLVLWNLCVDDQKAYYLEHKGIINFYEYDKYYYPKHLKDHPEFALVPSKARQDMYRRCCNVTWRHIIPKSASKEWPYRDKYKSPINSFFFCRYGIRFTDDAKRRVWVSNIHSIKLLEKGYLKDEDIPIITSGRICFRRPSGRWHVRFILTVDNDYYKGRIKMKTQTVQEPIGIDLGVKRYATIASTNPEYKYPELLKKMNNPLLGDKLWQTFKKIQSLDRRIDQIERRNMVRHGIDPNNLEEVWHIPTHLKDEIYHTRRLRILRRRKARLLEHMTRARGYFIKRLVHDLTTANHAFISIETLDLPTLLSRRKGGHMMRRRIAFCSFGYFISFLKWKCSALGIPVEEAEPFFPSTQTCSICGTVKREKLDLDTREFICDNISCPIHTEPLDRDYNAAINILQSGLHKRPRSIISSNFADLIG